jgi:lipase chaperone LimK
VTQIAVGLLAAAAVLLGGLAGLWPESTSPGVSAGAPPPSPDRDPSPATDVPRVDLLAPRLPPRPSSLAGTQEDGALVVSADGRFVPTADAIDLFDYYLSASGEEPEERIRQRILAAIDARLEGQAAESARRLFDDYLVYRARVAELLGGSLPGEDLERRLQYLRELRRDVFGAETARALFGEQEAQWFADLERQRVLQDPAFASEEAPERERRLAELDAELPPRVREARERARAASLLRDEEARLRESGAGDAEIARLREERFGSEAAARLAALDEARADWLLRLGAYRAERDRVRAESAPEERDALVDELRARHFEGAELERVRALERVEEDLGSH